VVLPGSGLSSAMRHLRNRGLPHDRRVRRRAVAVDRSGSAEAGKAVV
jgi:hypothetical protein